jgi:serine/threonine protein kinase
LSEQSQGHDATVDFASELSADLLREFEAAWQESLIKGSPEPSLTAFLARGPAASAPIVKEQLKELDHEYRQRLRRDGLTQFDTTGAIAKTGAGGSTGDATFRLDKAPDTQRLEASQETGDFSAKIGDARTDFSLLADPQATLASVSAAADANLASFMMNSAKEEPSQEAVSKVVGGYDILGVLGRGAMGVVYKARHRGLKRVVALKMILAGEHAGETQLNRFRIEAEAVAQLQHPNIVQVYEVGEHDGCPFLSLEFVDGGSLHQKLGGEPQPVQASAQMVMLLAQAMDFAHRKGIVHRDLKPANVMLMVPQSSGSKETLSGAPALVSERYGMPKIADFGLAKRVEEDTGTTRTGAILGTPSYMAPEQAAGRSKEVGPLADQYALGAMLYEMLAGRPPFRGTTVMETIEQVRKQEPVPPSKLQPNLPRDLETICLKALQKEPEKRYLDCETFAEDLRRFVAGEPIMARPVSAPERLWRWCKRNPKLALASATIASLLLVVSIGSTWAAITIQAEKELAQLNEQKALTNEKIAQEQKAFAQANEQKAIASEKLAEDQAELALNTLGLLINKVQTQLSKQPGVQELKRELLQTAMNGLKRVTGGGAGQMSRHTSDAYFKMGGIARELGNTADARGYWQQYYEMARAALKDNPDNEHSKLQMAWASRFLGEISAEQGDLKKALEHYLSALELRKELAAVPFPERVRRNDKLSEEDRLTPRMNELQLSEEYTRVGLIYYFLGDSAHAEEPVLKSLTLRENLVREVVQDGLIWFLTANPVSAPAALAVAASVPNWVEQLSETRQNLARNYHLIGEIYFRLRNLKQSRAYYQKCEDIREAILRDDEDAVQRLKQLGKPRPPDYRLMGDLAELHQMCATMLLSLGAPLPEVLPHNDRAIVLSRRVLEMDKAVEPQQNLASALYSRGMVAVRAGDSPTATKCFLECLGIRQELSGKDPSSFRKKLDLLEVLARAGKHGQAAQLAEQLRLHHQKDGEFLISLARAYAQCSLAVPDNRSLKEHYLEKALAAVQTALEQGYKDVITLETHPDFDPVRESPAFKKLLEKVDVARLK